MLAQGTQAEIDYLVPNRFEYGYGLTPEIVELAAQRQPDLLITVDNGIASVDGVARATELGIDVLITDHHLPGAMLPQAACIVNPNQPGCGFPSKHLAGVGVMPRSVSSRQLASSCRTCSISWSRPTNELSCCARLLGALAMERSGGNS